MKRIYSSGSLTSDTLVTVGPAWWLGSILRTDGTNDATLDVYDGTDATGLLLFPDRVIGADNIGGVIIGVHMGIWCETSLWVDITGTSAYCVVYYAFN